MGRYADTQLDETRPSCANMLADHEGNLLVIGELCSQLLFMHA